MRSDSTEYDVANRKIFTECCGTIENLSENQEYEFRVFAMNEVGEGDRSKPITATIQDDESTNVTIKIWSISKVLIESKSQTLTNVCLSTVSPVITILKFFKSNAIIVKKGSAIDIPAEVKGLPLPTLQWLKDDVVIEKPDEEKMTMETEEVRMSQKDPSAVKSQSFL